MIGVITSPTGAVIRDILHRLRERWPSHVMVWPVVVQGGDAARQVAAAVRGFNALPPLGPIRRPDVLIIARGGGSIEDLWPFNDEALARAVAASAIPLISAVGHETDVTLIDFVADRRAPTPTAAAEIATPVLSELRIQLAGLDQRISRSAQALLDVRRTRLQSAARGLPRPADLLGLAGQRFDQAAGRLAAALRANVRAHHTDLVRAGGRLSAHLLEQPLRRGAVRILELDRRRIQAGGRLLRDLAERVERLDRVRRSLDPDGPLARGFARVHKADASLVRSAGALSPGDALQLVFQDGRRSAVVSDGRPVRSTRRADGLGDMGQGRLL
jgi:exodeoxyribonuclease VII large subunit